MDQESSKLNPRTGWVRVGIAAAQAILLYCLYRAGTQQVWPATMPMVFFPLLLCGLSLPVIAISSLGQMATGKLLRWLGFLALVLTGLTLHDWLRRNGLNNEWDVPDEVNPVAYPSSLLFMFSFLCLYVAQSLKLAYEQKRQGANQYPLYFDMSWKLLVQLVFSGVFVAALFAVLYLGAALFSLLKLEFLSELLKREWFTIPVIVLAFGCALHLTDMRPAIVRGIRNLLLVLLSWLLPLATLVLAGFLLTLAVQGTELLWDTRQATNLLLGACVVLVVLINTAYQDGAAFAGVPKILRWSVRLACVLLPVLALLALRALQLRIAQYGWSSDRLIAVVCALLALGYGLAYTRAALAQDGLLGKIAGANVVMAYAHLTAVLALFSPVLDPARIAVADQLSRLRDGKVTADKFDYRYLRFQGGRYGREALEQMMQEKALPQSAQIREKAAIVLALTRQEYGKTEVEIIHPFEVWPQGASLPEGFLRQSDNKEKGWLSDRDAKCLIAKTRGCDVLIQDVNRDGKPEVLVLDRNRNYGGNVYFEVQPGVWQSEGRIDVRADDCEKLNQGLRAGHAKPVPAWDMLDVDGLRLLLIPDTKLRQRCKS